MKRLHRNSSVVRVAWLAVGAVLLAGPVLASAIPATETSSEVFRGGVDEATYRARMAELYDWLWSERAATPLEPGLSVQLSRQDRIDIGEEPCADCDGRLLVHPGKLRVGVVKAAHSPIDFRGLNPGALRGTMLFARGGIRQAPDGLVWTLTAGSDEARGLRVHFAGFDLPEGAELYIYNDAGEAYGPYSGRGPDGTGEFWSHSVGGSHAYVQMRYFGELDRPSLAALRFRITHVAHLGSQAVNPVGLEPEEPVTATSFCSFNESCVVNASCTSDPAVADAEDAIAHMQWISGAFIYICTGGLIADTDAGSSRPLFLTANHCLSRGKEAKSLETFFRFTTPCNGSCPKPFTDPPGVQKTLGATVLATGSTGDYTLLELNQDPPPGTTMMGWNSTPIANSNGAALHRISHPGGAPQAYSEHRVDTSAVTCQGIPRGAWIYSRDVVGATEGGSSGSPVVNGAGQVVGQLTGACGYNTGNPCDSARNATIDGALAGYFSSVASFLDPDTGGGGNPGGCDDDGVCEPGEDCTNCGDCPGVTGGRPSNRYCCGNGVQEGVETSALCDGNF